MEQTHALCLGVGALGCAVTVALCRLGVAKVTIIDKDVVELHNLNRQMLYSKQHVGQSKVTSAVEVLRDCHCVATQVIGLEVDAVKEWATIVKLSATATVIFNMVDVGDIFDAAVQSLALSRGIPLCQGGNFQFMYTVDYCGATGKPCWLCMSDLKDNLAALVQQKLLPSTIQQCTDLSFIEEDDKPTGESSYLLAAGCGNAMVNTWLNALMGFGEAPSRHICYLSDMSVLPWAMEADPLCPFCSIQRTGCDTVYCEGHTC